MARKSSEFAMTLAEVGAKLGITAERVRQIECCAMTKVRLEFERRGISHDSYWQAHAASGHDFIRLVEALDHADT